MKKILLTNKIQDALHYSNASIKKGLATLFILCASYLSMMANPPTCQNYGNAQAENILYRVNGNTVPSLANVSSGDQVEICFTLSAGSNPTIFSLVSYKAPSASFDAATAHLQTVFSMETKTFSGAGQHCLKVTVPSCYFQLDFVKGCVIYQFGPQGSNNFYSNQNRLIVGVTGGKYACNCFAHADAGADTSLKCKDTQLTLHGSTFTHNPVISWQAINGGNIVSGANTLYPVINAAGTYILTVFSSLQCSATDTVIVTGHTNVLTPGMIGSDQTNCGPFKPALLTGMNATANPGETIEYQWLKSIVNVPNTYGNPYWVPIPGATSASYQPDSIFITTYFVRCARTVGCTFLGTTTESNIVTITILPKPNVDLGNDTTICAGEIITLNAGNPGLHFLWSTGATTQTIVVSSTGTYYVTVWDNVLCKASDTIHVTVLPDLDVDLGKDTTVVFCVGYLTLDAGNSGMKYLWSTGATTQTINVVTSGSYYVTVSNGLGCSASDTINVIVNPGQLTVDLGKDTSFVSCHDTLILDAGVVVAAYLWSTGATTQTIAVTTSGVYAVTVTDELGCTASDIIVVTITDNSVDIDLGPDTTVCGCILLDAGNPGATFTWCGGQNYQAILVCTTGVYCVEVHNGNCIASDTIVVTVVPPPVVNLGNDTTLSGMLILDAGNPGASFLWSTGATTQTLIVTSSGEYYVMVTDAFGCTASDTILVNVTTGISENFSTGFPLYVYPNPSDDQSFTMSFDVPERENVEIRIMSQLGLLVYSERLENFKGTYNKKIVLQDLAGGIYFANVLSDTKKSIIKITLK